MPARPVQQRASLGRLRIGHDSGPITAEDQHRVLHRSAVEDVLRDKILAGFGLVDQKIVWALGNSTPAGNSRALARGFLEIDDAALAGPVELGGAADLLVIGAVARLLLIEAVAQAVL